MSRPVVFIVLVLCLLPPAYTQSVIIPAKLDELVQRSEEFRRLLAAGNRVKASEFVLPADRDKFLNDPAAALQNPQITGMDFLDKDTVRVRTAGKMAVAPTGSSPQISNTQAADMWIRQQNRWYFQPAAKDNLLTRFGANPSADSASLAEIRSSFKLLTDEIHLGQLVQGELRYVKIPIEYTGSTPIRLAPKLETPLATLDMKSVSWITRESKEFGVWVSAEDLEGPFNTTLTFTVYYQSVAIDLSIQFDGTVFAPFTFRQLPEIVPAASYANFQLFVRNNNDVAVKIAAIAGDEYFFVDEFPSLLNPGEEGRVLLRRNVKSSSPGRSVSLYLDSPVNGKTIYNIRIR